MTKKGGSFWKSQAAKQPRLYFVLEYCDSLGVVCCFQSGLPGYCRWLVAEKFRVRKVSWSFFLIRLNEGHNIVIITFHDLIYQ